jgi:hypothetical protein
MNRQTRLALGAFGIAAGCTLAATPALAEEHYHGSSGPSGGNSHSSAAPSHSWGGGGGPRVQSYGGAPHFPSGGSFVQHQQFYRPPSSGRFWPGQHSAPQYRAGGSWQGGQHTTLSGHGYAPGAWAHGFNGSHSAAAHHNAFYSFRGRSISGLAGHDREIWRGGQWRHSWHNGHYGWWWFAGGGWYFYDEPIYPYPEYISDYDYDDYGDDAYGPGDVWYYCDAPQGYYPYVTQCMDPWQAVPAQ